MHCITDDEAFDGLVSARKAFKILRRTMGLLKSSPTFKEFSTAASSFYRVMEWADSVKMEWDAFMDDALEDRRADLEQMLLRMSYVDAICAFRIIGYDHKDFLGHCFDYTSTPKETWHRAMSCHPEFGLYDDIIITTEQTN